MNVLIIDSDLTGLDFAYRCAEAGHSVKLYQAPHKDGSKVWDGFGFPGIERVSSWRNHMTWARNGIIANLFNDQKLTKELDDFRKFKMPIFGPSVKSAELEWFRGKGMAFMEAHGIEVPKYHTFKTLEEVEKFAWKADEPFCFKTMGDEADKSLTFVPSNPAELVSWIETKKRQGIKLKGPLMLQEKIDMVAEIGISGWVGKEGFLKYKNLNFEFKKNLAGEFGRAVGEEGTVTKYYEENSLATDMLIPFEKSLVEMGHFGDFDVGMGVDSKGKVWPYEFSARFGWPSTPILMACHTSDPVEWMREAVVTGKDILEVDDRVAMGVIMTRPPYPSSGDEDPQSSVGYVVEGIEDVWDHVSPWQLMIEEGPVWKGGKVQNGPCYKTAGPYVCTVTALGSDVHDVIPEVYAVIDKIKFPDRQVRIDVGKRLETELPKLKALGFEVPDW
jgi:phosphoribosylamine---glycine ligase